MTSKSSFLVSLMENNKRRLWVWVISLLTFIVVFPTATALVANRVVRRTEWIIENYGSELAQQILHERLISDMCSTLGFSILTAAMAIIIAIISAIQGFSYLYSRKKIDFYMGMPVKRKKRFLVIWLNGIILYLVPYLLGLLISTLIAAANGGVDGTVIHAAVMAFGVNFCLYLGVYHMAILAVMLTGNIVITGFAFLVFCVYEFMVRCMLQSYQGLFFQYFSYYSSNTTPLLSPFSMYMKMADAFSNRNIVEAKNLIGLFVFAIVVGLVAYVCYLRRPAEAAGRAMTFAITKPVVKILLIVPASLVAGLLIANTISFDPDSSMKGIGYVIFAIVLVVVIGCALMQVIYEFDIKGALHKKTHIVICGVLTALIFLAFRYDLTGYDSYIPKSEALESVAFVPDYYEEGMHGSAHFDSDGTYMSSGEYADQYMHLKNVADVCELAEISMNGYNEYLERYEQKGNIDDQTDMDDQTECWSSGTLIYHLKNGRKVSRSIYVNVNDERTSQLLDQIIGSEEFKKGYMAGASENLTTMMADEGGKRRISATYGNGVYTRKMSEADAKSFLEIYRADLALANFSNVRESTPLAVFDLSIEEDIMGSADVIGNGISRSTRTWMASMNIYPFYEKSITWLKEHGYYMDYQLNVDDVDHIQVINQNYEAKEKLEEKLNTTAGAAAIAADTVEAATAVEVYGEYEVDTRVYVDYTEKDDIALIADCVYPEDMRYGFDWDGGKTFDDGYQVIVYFKAGSEINRNYGTNAYYCFMKGQVPDFVMEDTLYKE